MNSVRRDEVSVVPILTYRLGCSAFKTTVSRSSVGCAEVLGFHPLGRRLVPYRSVFLVLTWSR
ncbi:unnamed protein product [Prunus armeniaca]